MTTAEQVALYCKEVLPIATLSLKEESFAYPELSCCVIDAVWSLNVRYEGVRNVVRRYRNWSRNNVASSGRISDFIESISTLSSEQAANTVFQNRQRTSTRSGILKAEAVVRFARVLQSYQIETIDDLTARIEYLPEIEKAIRKIPGQHSGISWRYFLMLCGANDLVKPDRMILRFLQRVTGKNCSIEEAQNTLSEVSHLLSHSEAPILTRTLDNAIWRFERTRQNTARNSHAS